MVTKYLVAPGQVYGKLTVVSESTTPHRVRRWDCECECGNFTTVEQTALGSGKTRSCGCLVRTVNREMRITHGLSKHPLYPVWKDMHRRCSERGNYGGRGIHIDSLFDTIEGFIEHSPAGYLPGLTLERVDNDGDYTPSNLRWASKGEQSYNKTSTIWVIHPDTGEEVSLGLVAKEFGISYGRMYNLVAVRGMSAAEAVSRHSTLDHLTVEVAKDIKRALWHMTVPDTARWYNQPIRRIQNIANGKTYSHIDELED